MKKEDFFSFSIYESGRKTTKYFSKLVKFSSLLILLDRYLLSNLTVKQQVSHVLQNDTIGNSVTIEEETSYEGEVGVIFRRFLKSGKELVLSSLLHIETTSDLDDLLKRLSKLFYQTQEELRPHDFLDVLSHSKLDKIAFARILNHFWLYFTSSGASNPITIDSLDGSPRVAFSKMPPLREWLPKEVETIQVEKIELRHVDFGDFKRWKAVLFNYLHDSPMVVEMVAPKFLEGLKSKEENEENGILHGDILFARYSILKDLLLNKTTIKILDVHMRARQSQATQLQLFSEGDRAPSEPSPTPKTDDEVKTQKRVKHNSWSKKKK